MLLALSRLVFCRLASMESALLASISWQGCFLPKPFQTEDSVYLLPSTMAATHIKHAKMVFEPVVLGEPGAP